MAQLMVKIEGVNSAVTPSLNKSEQRAVLRDERSNGCDQETTHGNVFMSDKNEILIDYCT